MAVPKVTIPPTVSSTALSTVVLFQIVVKGPPGVALHRAALVFQVPTPPWLMPSPDQYKVVPRTAAVETKSNDKSKPTVDCDFINIPKLQNVTHQPRKSARCKTDNGTTGSTNAFVPHRLRKVNLRNAPARHMN